MYKFKFKPQRDLPKEIIKKAALAGLGEVIYLLLVSWFFMAGSAVFPIQTSNAILGIMALLILFVASAAVSGALILGYPIFLAWQKKYQEAIIALTAAILTLFLFFILLIISALLF